MIQRTNGGRKKLTSPGIPEVPEIDPAWIEALKNSKPVAPTASVGMKMPYTNVRQADEALTSRSQAQADYKAYYDQRVPVRTGDPYVNSVKSLADVAFRHGVKYPIEGMNRTLSGKNFNTYMNPFNDASLGQKFGALSEDALNVAAVVPFLKGAGILGKAGMQEVKTMVAPELYEYGLHTTKNPTLTYVDPNVTKNMGAAKDALDGYAYQWRMSDPKTGAGFNTLSDRATTDAMAWSDRLADNMSIDSINTYLTRGKAAGVIDDANLAGELVNGRNKAAAVPGQLEIFGKASSPADSYWNDRESYQQAIKNMIESRKREIALNNTRLNYARGTYPRRASGMPDWSSLTPDEMGFATTFNRNTPASVIKQAMIDHDMQLEGITQKGIRDIAQTMAQRQGMDITQAYDVAETFSNFLRRGGQRPGSN